MYFATFPAPVLGFPRRVCKVTASPEPVDAHERRTVLLQGSALLPAHPPAALGSKA